MRWCCWRYGMVWGGMAGVGGNIKPIPHFRGLPSHGSLRLTKYFIKRFLPFQPFLKNMLFNQVYNSDKTRGKSGAQYSSMGIMHYMCVFCSQSNIKTSGKKLIFRSCFRHIRMAIWVHAKRFDLPTILRKHQPWSMSGVASVWVFATTCCDTKWSRGKDGGMCGGGTYRCVVGHIDVWWSTQQWIATMFSHQERICVDVVHWLYHSVRV